MTITWWVNGNGPGSHLVKFIFFSGQTEDRISYTIPDDQCITPNRTVRIGFYMAFQDLPGETVYGYDLDTEVHTIRVAGNDETNGKTVDEGGKCLAVDEGATEDIPLNYAPSFSSTQGHRTLRRRKH